jgi:DNA primase small subunit
LSKRVKEIDFLRLKFQEYYLEDKDRVDTPNRIHMREFGIERWDYAWKCVQRTEQNEDGNAVTTGCGSSGTTFTRIVACPKCSSSDIQVTNWSRHIGFRNLDSLLRELASLAPPSVYHSAAYYSYPVARHMHEKQWQGAELIFDIDADHLELECTEDHDSWKCKNKECGEAGKGGPPSEGCPKCGGLSFRNRKWICDSCLTKAKENTVKIVDQFLVNDLGISSENIILNYSGHRGYHIRVLDPAVFELNANARMEIIHHIAGLGFNSQKVISQQGQGRVISDRSGMGWAGKTADALIDFIRNIDSYTGSGRWVHPLKKHKSEALDGLLRNPPVLSPKVKQVGAKSWQEIAELAVTEYGGHIDVPVTHDIHRVIRLIGSLNGKTGFEVTPLTREQIDQFDPFKDAIAFSDGMLRVKVHEKTIAIPEFRIGDDIYGPYLDQVIELPMAAAMFLICKGVARID